jgi:NAD-dependent dihydropyrimidine dehydrogenase PreA subunit
LPQIEGGDKMTIDDFFIGSRDTETHRVCGICGELKPKEEFYRDGKDRNGSVRYRRDCIACYKESRKRERKLKRKLKQSRRQK